MWLGLEVGSAACSCCGLWELLLRNRVTARGMWVRAWPPSRDATSPSFAWDGVKATPEMGWECFNVPYPKRTGPPGSLQPALSLWESWAWCLGFLIALGSCRARGGTSVGISGICVRIWGWKHPSSGRSQSQNPSLVSVAQSLKNPMGSPILPGGRRSCGASPGVEDGVIPSVCGEKPHANPPGCLQDPKGCFGVCSCLECPKGAGRAGSKAGARMMPLMSCGAGKQPQTSQTPKEFADLRLGSG